MILYRCDRNGCPSQVEHSTTYLGDWRIMAPLDGLLPDKHYCSRDCAIQDMASFEIPEEIPHG